MKPKLRLVSSSADPRPRRYVCPWCAAGFMARAALDRHFIVSPACGRHKNINSTMQNKYGVNDVDE